VTPNFPEHVFYSQSVQYGYILDFYCPTLKLGIEVDGASHNNRQGYDWERDSHLQKHGIQILRTDNEQVFNNSQDLVNSLNKIIMEKSQREQNRYSSRGYEGYQPRRYWQPFTNFGTCRRALSFHMATLYYSRWWPLPLRRFCLCTIYHWSFNFSYNCTFVDTYTYTCTFSHSFANPDFYAENSGIQWRSAYLNCGSNSSNNFLRSLIRKEKTTESISSAC